MDRKNKTARQTRRRRTCIDEMRRGLARQRNRRGNLAGKTMLQLLTLLSGILALAPQVQDMPPRRDRRQPPSWYTLGSAAWARERGLDPEEGEFPVVPTPRLAPMPRPHPGCSWSRLVRDLSRRPTRDRAREMIQQRVPPEALVWLRSVIADEDWATLRMLGRDANPELIRDRAIAWAIAAELLDRQSDLGTTDDIEPTDGSMKL